MELLNLVLSLFAGTVLLQGAFSALLQRASLPAPLLALLAGVLMGPHALGLLDLAEFGVETGTLLEQAARLTLGVGLVGVALRLPHGYWRANWRWVAAIIGLGMAVMFAVAAGVLWVGLGLSFPMALLLGAVITPTDPIVTTPIVTGSVAEQHIPDRVRYNLSAESGINDGLGYLFVFLPILLLTSSTPAAWQHLLTRVLLWEVLGAALLGAVAGYVLARLFVLVTDRDLIEETSYLALVVPLGLLVLGGSKLAGTDGVLAVFVAAAVFGQTVPQTDEAQEAKIDDTINRFLIIPVFLLLGLALPIPEWLRWGAGVPLLLAAALLVRRLVAVWLLRPLYRGLHNRPETAFMSWFGAIGVSALYYATVAERLTGNHEVFLYTTLAITLSVVLHGVSATPLSALLDRTLTGGRDGRG